MVFSVTLIKDVRDVSDDDMKAYVKHQKSLKSRARSKHNNHKSKSEASVYKSYAGEGECNSDVDDFLDNLSEFKFF